MRIINASIDVSKIDKSKIVTTDKNGQPFKNGAKYLNVSIFVNDEPNQYDQDCSITISQSKEESENKVPKVYIGNGKTVFNNSNPMPKPNDIYVIDATVVEVEPDDLPF